MKYINIYQQLMYRAKGRELIGYKEKHHIVPRSFGGSNDKDNLVYLTAREHFICHWLLVKMHIGQKREKMIYALRMMRVTNNQQDRYETRITARVYETYRIEHAKNHSKKMTGRPANNKGKVMSEEQRKKLSIAATGKKYSAETIAKRVAKILGTTKSDETKAKMSAAAKGKLKGPMSATEKLKRSLTLSGIKKPKTHGANVAAAVTGSISINKDGIEKKVKKDILQSWLDKGWLLGGRKRLR